MLSTIFTLLLLLSLLLLIWGLISPKSLSKGQKKEMTRKEAGWTFGILTLIFFVLVGITAPEPENKGNLSQNTHETPAVEEQNIEEATSEEIPQEEIVEEIKVDPRYFWHEVVNVVDGDTVKARVDGKVESIRIIGINSPESTIRTECFGKKASDKAKEFLSNKWIQLERDDSQSNRDKYGRILRYIWFDEGTDFGRRMIEEGYAYEYTYDIPYDKQKQYKETQKYAENKNNGLWSPKTCDGKKTKPAPKIEVSKPSSSSSTNVSQPSTSTSSGVVKKSSTGICHAPGTTYYDRTTNYTGYSSLKACLNSGGRLPLR